MRLPDSFLQSLHGVPGFDKETFEAVHQSGEQVTSVRLNPAKFSTQELTHHSPLTTHQNIPWSPYGYYLSQRPSFTFDPLFHAGCYYVQEASSQFLEQAVKQTVDLTRPLKVLDLCAAPGGKTTHLQSLLSKESLLVSNEIIRGRCAVLIDNVIKWGAENVVVTNNDPVRFGNLPGFFDVMIVDAPCSGSGLFRRDEEAMNEWSLNNVALCSGRQQRILADALPALKEGGILIYSTCSYSAEEDEAIADWLLSEQRVDSIPLKLDAAWHIVQTVSAEKGAYGYRFFPDKVKGEGFYLACFRKRGSSTEFKYKRIKANIATAKEGVLMRPWLARNDVELLKPGHNFFAVPKNLLSDVSVLQNLLNVQYVGVEIGELLKDKFIPAHALALSPLPSSEIPVFDLAYADAITYLQKGELKITPGGTGRMIVAYQNHNLGWINALPNRINNYYPKELRILKQTPGN